MMNFKKAAALILLIFVFFPAFAQKKTSAKKAPTNFILNFKDVEISDFITMMSQILNKNVVYDEQLRGKITISSSKNIPISQAREVLITILSVKGYTIVEMPNLIRVVPLKDAPKETDLIIVDGQEIKFKDDTSIVYTCEIESGDLNEIFRTLNTVKTNSMSIVAYPPLKYIIFNGSAREISSLVKLAKSLDKSASGNTEAIDAQSFIHVVKLQNSKAEDMAAVLSKVPTKSSLQSQRSAPTAPNQPPHQVKNEQISIIPSKDTNSLIITATPEEFAEIKRLINALDTVRDQVLIEAVIMEVNTSDGWTFGIDWFLSGSAGQGNAFGEQILGNVPNYTEKSIYNTTVPLFTGFNLGYFSGKGALGFLLLNATANDNKVNILSTPQILTLDNQEAVIYAGSEVPVPTNAKYDSNNNLTYTFDYKSVGIKLKVTPHITDTDRITLDLYQEANSIISEGTIEGATYTPPTLGKRDITTKVTVYDGKTIVVGGLISNQASTVETKVPILGDIPLLGWLFKNKTVKNEKKNLLIFISPTIATKKEVIENISNEKINEHKKLNGEFKYYKEKSKDNELKEKDHPVKPEENTTDDTKNEQKEVK